MRLASAFLLVLHVPTIALVSAAPGSGALPQRAETPQLVPGEFWVYRWEERRTRLDGPEAAGRTFRGRYRQTVLGRIVFQGRQAYLLRRDDGSFDLLSLDLWELARLDPSGAVFAVFGVKADPQFPLYIGRVYTRWWRNPLGRYQATFRYTVSGMTEIETPAGRFSAFRIIETGRGSYDDGGTFTEWGTSYFAPSVKRFVRSLIETDTRYRFLIEMEAYGRGS